MLSGSRLERFFEFVELGEPEECWPWKGGKDHKGYGKFSVKIDGKWKSKVAHRIAYENSVGPIPDGLQLDHLCRNTSCVNPDHLEPVTLRENVLRGISPIAENARKIHCSKGHPFEGLDANGGRKCPICLREARARYNREHGIVLQTRAERLAAIEPKHGTNSRYTKRACRCDLCRQAGIEYSREYRRRKKAEREAEAGLPSFRGRR